MNYFAMQRLNPVLARNLQRFSAPSKRTFTSSTTRQASNGKGDNTHVTDSKDELDIQSEASKSGKRDKAVGNTQSSATSEKDLRNDNARAKKDNPEAPGPVIGMNDERGGVSDDKGIVVF